METKTNGDVVMSWAELAELNHAEQVRLFGFCTCEDKEDSEYPYKDCAVSND